MRLYLIRHPLPAVAPGVCYGQSDLPLAAPPETLAAALRRQLPAGTRLHSSPLRRCLELARAITGANETTLRIDPRLTEMHFGEWEGRTWDTIGREPLEHWAADPTGYAPPGGESARAMAARVIAFARAELAPDAGPAHAVIAHQGPLRVLAADWLGLTERDWLDLHFDCGALNLIERDAVGSRWRHRNLDPTDAAGALTESEPT